MKTVIAAIALSVVASTSFAAQSAGTITLPGGGEAQTFNHISVSDTFGDVVSAEVGGAITNQATINELVTEYNKNVAFQSKVSDELNDIADFLGADASDVDTIVEAMDGYAGVVVEDAKGAYVEQLHITMPGAADDYAEDLSIDVEGFASLTAAVDAAMEEAWAAGYDDGFSAGFADGVEDAKQALKDANDAR